MLLLRNNECLATTPFDWQFCGTALSADLWVVGEPSLPIVLPVVFGLNGKLGIDDGALDEGGFRATNSSISATPISS